MMMCEWEIGVLLDTYAETDKSEEMQTLYARAIELTVKDNCGLTMPIDLAIDWVSRGSITDYDGFGRLLDEDGEEIGEMECDVTFLQKAKENNACYVAWYNK